MNKVQEIFAKYCSNQYLISEYENFVDYETNAENEVIYLSIFDSDYHGDFPFVDNLALFISDFKKLKQLEVDIFGGCISDLQPLIDLQDLEKIYIECTTQIDNLDFVQNMKKLKSVHLQSSDIQDISQLANNKELTSIALPFSQIQDISPILTLAELTFINFNNNQISNIDSLQHCQKLQNIRLNNNQIKSIDSLQNLYELTGISISNNQISDLNVLQHLTNIEYLEVWNNQVSDIDFLHHFKKLKNLQIPNNRIKKVSNFVDFPQLQFLNIAENEIENIDFLSNNNSLLRLNISKNPIRSVEVLSRLESLDVLIAAYVNFKISDNFQFQSQLKTLILNHCNIQNVGFLLNQKQITQLKLSDNRISNIEGFENFKELKSLNLRNNQITEAIPYQFLRLVAIDLSGNNFGNQLFGDFSTYFRSSPAHYTHIFEEIKDVEKASIRDLRKLIADDYLQKGEKEAALAAYYFDALTYNSTTNRKLLDVRLYLLKHLSNQNSPFVFNLQQKLLKTLQIHFASTQEERKLKADYLDKILNIEAQNIDKPTINSNEFTYFFQHQAKTYPIEFHATLEDLLTKEKELFSDIVIQLRREKRYETKTSKDDSTAETIGCTVYIIFIIVLFAMVLSDSISSKAMQTMVFIAVFLRIVQYLYYKNF